MYLLGPRLIRLGFLGIVLVLMPVSCLLGNVSLSVLSMMCGLCDYLLVRENFSRVANAYKLDLKVSKLTRPSIQGITF